MACMGMGIGCGCGGSGPVNPCPGSPPAGAECCRTWAIPQTIFLTDALGTYSMTYGGMDSFGNKVWGLYYTINLFAYPSAELTSHPGICTFGTPGTAPVQIAYQLVCEPNGGGTGVPQLFIQRSWGVGPVSLGGPDNYAPCNGTVGGITSNSCITGNPPPTNSLSYGTASGLSCGGGDGVTDQLSAPTTVSPFAVTSSLPNGPFFTTDPVGGGVTITS
jgi:hypothetical protein